MPGYMILPISGDDPGTTSEYNTMGIGPAPREKAVPAAAMSEKDLLLHDVGRNCLKSWPKTSVTETVKPAANLA